jgi:hypothetical protein
MAKESPLRAELGDKKYNEKVEKVNKFYDRYKAGKRDPKTGEYYHHISATDPSKPKYSFSNSCLSVTIGHVKCQKCKAKMSVGSNSLGKFCLYCGGYNYFSAEMKDELRAAANEESDE